MSKIEVVVYDDVHIRILAERGILYELRDAFSFFVPGYKFNPKYKYGVWDGRIRLFNSRTGKIYKGLLEEIIKFAEMNSYEIVIDPSLTKKYDYSYEEASNFYKSLNLPEKLEERDYQLKSFQYCIENRRAFFVSPTASGKSLIIYMILKYYDEKTLIIVDSLNLLTQMFSDFAEYGFDSEKNVHIIKSGSDKYSDKQIIVSTWQSAVKQPKEWFEQFDLVIGDEAHKFTAKSLVTIMEHTTNCKKKFGFTGSTDGSKTNILVLQGLFGQLKQLVTVRQLQDEGTLAESEINCITLEYTDEEKKEKRKYQDELKFLYTHPKRNAFLINLMLRLDKNRLLLFHRLEHGTFLYEQLKKKTNIPVYYVAGSVKGDEREKIRKIVDSHEESITIASLGTFSTGVNIPHLHHVVFSAPTKAINTITQSIGRGLRKTSTKLKCIYYDISDNLKWKSRINYTMKHFMERLKLYIKEKHKYKLHKVKLK